MRLYLWIFAVCLIASGGTAQEVSISSDGRQLEEINGRLFERLDDMYLEYEGLGPRSVQPVEVSLWPDGVLPIAFQDGYLDADQRAFFEACDMWAEISRVNCIERTDQTDFLEVTAGDGNWSFLGQIGGRQELSLFNRQNRGIIAHELAHALGFAHQHNSPERNAFVEIQWENIQSAARHNFRRVPQAILFGFYDYCSIMHYGLDAFTSNGQPTIEFRGQPDIDCTPGQRTEITIEDSMGMAGAYGRDEDDRLFVVVPEYADFRGFAITDPNWSFSRFGLFTAIVSGDTRDECVRHTICETTCYWTAVSTQTPEAGERVEFGTTVNLTTFVDGKYIFYAPPNTQCP